MAPTTASSSGGRRSTWPVSAAWLCGLPLCAAAQSCPQFLRPWVMAVARCLFFSERDKKKSFTQTPWWLLAEAAQFPLYCCLGANPVLHTAAYPQGALRCGLTSTLDLPSSFRLTIPLTAGMKAHSVVFSRSNSIPQIQTQMKPRTQQAASTLPILRPGLHGSMQPTATMADTEDCCLALSATSEIGLCEKET